MPRYRRGLEPGNKVRVISGTHAGKAARIISVTSKTVRIMPVSPKIREMSLSLNNIEPMPPRTKGSSTYRRKVKPSTRDLKGAKLVGYLAECHALGEERYDPERGRERYDAGYGIKLLLKSGLNARQIKVRGVTCENFIKVGFSPLDAIEIGFSFEEISRLPDFSTNNLPAWAVLNAEFGLGRAQERGLKKVRTVAGDEARKIDAGTNKKRFKNLINTMCNAGYSVEQLRNSSALKKNRLTMQQILPAKGTLHPNHKLADFVKAGFSLEEIRLNGFNVEQLHLAGVKLADIAAKTKFTYRDYTSQGYNAGVLFKNHEVFLQDLSKLLGGTESLGRAFRMDDVTPDNIYKQHNSLRTIRMLGYDAKTVRESITSLGREDTKANAYLKAGYSVKELIDVFDPRELLATGLVTARQINQARSKK